VILHNADNFRLATKINVEFLNFQDSIYPRREKRAL